MEAVYTIRLEDRFTSPLSKLEGRMNSFEGKFSGVLSKAVKFAGTLGIAFGAAEVVRGIVNLGGKIVNLGAQMEQTRAKFEVMLGSAQEGNKMVEAIQKFASRTPLQTSDLIRNAELLLNFGASAESIIPSLQMIGDVAGGNAERMNSLTLAFAQVQSQGRLMGQDLLQMVNAGFNPLQVISDKTGKSMRQLKDEMSKGKISFKDVENAFRAATSEGGRFFGLMDKQSKTFAGRWSTFKDQLEIIGIKLGEKILPYLGKMLDYTNRFVDLLSTGNFMPMLEQYQDVFSGLADIINEVWTALNLKGEIKLQSVIQGLSFIIRFSLTNLRLFITSINLIIKLVKTVAGMIGKLFEGDFKGIQNLGKKLDEDFANAFRKEVDGWRKIFQPATDYSAFKRGSGSQHLSTPNTKSTSSRTAMEASKEAGVEKIASSTRTINLRIDQLVGEIKFEKSIERSEAQMIDIVKKVLLTAVNDVNIVTQ